MAVIDNIIRINIQREQAASALGNDFIYSCLFILKQEFIKDPVVVTSLEEVVAAGYPEDSKPYLFAQSFYENRSSFNRLVIATVVDSYTEIPIDLLDKSLYVCIDGKSKNSIIDFAEFISTKNNIFLTSLPEHEIDEDFVEAVSSLKNTYVYAAASNQASVLGANYVGLHIDGVGNSSEYSPKYKLVINGEVIGEQLTIAQMIDYFLENGYSINYFTEPR